MKFVSRAVDVFVGYGSVIVEFRPEHSSICREGVQLRESG
jgi:hypothetical protein